jgi:ABC-type transport system involved in multi-copper enzyme maturation permease subunit
MIWRARFAPVAIVELVAVARRWQTYVARGGLVLALGITLALVCLSYQSGILLIGGQLKLREYAEAGTNFAIAVLSVQLALVLLAAPAGAAGAICIDKARGNLTLLLTTDMTATEFVSGKLVGRLAPVLALVVVSLPVLFITAFLGGINAELIGGGFIVLTGAAVLSCSVAILMSLYVGRTHEALLLSFFVIAGWMSLYPLSSIVGVPILPLPARWLWATNPVTLLLAPLDPILGLSFADYGRYLVWTFGLAAIFTLLAVVQLRRVVLGQANRPIRIRNARDFYRYRSPEQLDFDPLRWYERFRYRPSTLAQFFRFLLVVGALTAMAAAVFLPTFYGRLRDLPSIVGQALVGINLMLVIVRAVSTLADQRSRGSLDILATTPFTTPAILWAKWRTGFAAAHWMLILAWFIPLGLWLSRRYPSDSNWINGFVAVLFAYFQPLACAAMLTSLGLFLALQMKSFARAIGVAVVVYIALTVGWPLFLQILGVTRHTLVELQMLSPIVAFEMITSEKWPWYWRSSEFNLGAFISTGVYVGAAVYFYVICLIIANRKMGRIYRTESRPIPVVESVPTPAAATAAAASSATTASATSTTAAGTGSAASPASAVCAN